MICTTIQNRDFAGILDILRMPAVEMAEIRLDRCELSPDDIEELFATVDVPLVATCRVAEIRESLRKKDSTIFVSKLETKAVQAAEARLLSAIKGGAAFVDVEIEAPPMMSKRIRREAAENGTALVRSYHNFSGTDSLEALKAIADKCLHLGADIVKIVTTAATERDCDSVLSLYGSMAPDRLIAFCMGEAGRASRLDCLRYGAPYTYAALTDGEAAAPGQWTLAEMREALYAGARPAVGISAAVLSSALGDAPGCAPDSEGPAALNPAVGISAAVLSSALGDAPGCAPDSEGPAALNPAVGISAAVLSSALGDAPGCAPDSEGPAALNPAVPSEGVIKPCLRLRMPSSKSFAQRAIIAAALSDGISRLNGYSACGDNESAIAVAEALGAKVGRRTKGDSISLEIKGIGAVSGCFDKGELCTGESGFLTRMMIPLLGVLGRNPVHVSGEKTLIKRPLKGAGEMMAAFGLELEGDGEGEIRVPLTIKGRLNAGKATISGKDGSQLVSGLLAALPLAPKDSIVTLENPKSIPYIFITIDVLRRFGINISCEMEGGEDFMDTKDWNLCDGITFRIKGGQRYLPAELDIEADWSSAANFLVAGAIFGSMDLEGLDMKSLQADLSIMDVLAEAGASLSIEEESGLVHVQKAPLRAFDIDASNCPDLFPILAVLAAFCQGESRICGVGRLAGKESDRGKAILDMLIQMGVRAKIKGDRLIIEGHSLSQRLLGGNMLKGGKYTSSHDHRMVMALKVASLGADGDMEIDDTDCVGKSFPSFTDLFKRL